MAIQQVMEAASYEVMERECEFQITTSLATKITMISWKSINPDDLASGLTPFLLAPYATQEQKAQQKLVDIATIVYS